MTDPASPAAAAASPLTRKQSSFRGLSPDAVPSPAPPDSDDDAAEGPAPDAGRTPSVARDALAAAAAGGTGAVLTTVLFYPTELVKNRMQSSLKGGDFAYTGLFDGVRTILRAEGVRGLFAGVMPVTLRALATDFLFIGAGDLLIGTYRRAAGRDPAPAVDLALRVAGGWLSTPLSLPLDTVSALVVASKPRLSAGAAARRLLREGGVRAFFRGLRVMLILCVSPALTFATFDLLHGWLQRWLGKRREQKGRGGGADAPKVRLSALQVFLLGAVTKLVTLIPMYPLIRGKFLLQVHGDIGLVAVLRKVAAQEGPRSLYKGLEAQLSKSLLSTALLLTVKEQTQVFWRRLLLPR